MSSPSEIRRAFKPDPTSVSDTAGAGVRGYRIATGPSVISRASENIC